MPRLKSKQLRQRALESIEQLQWIADNADSIASRLRARALESIEILRWVADNAEHIARRANDDVDEGVRAVTYDGDGRGGQELTHPEAHVHARTQRDALGTMLRDDLTGQPLLRADTVAERITRLAGLGALIRDSAVEARRIGGKLIASVDPGDIAATRVAADARKKVGAGHCSNCNRYCIGTFADRLRGGRCDPCRKWWDRSGGTEERPRDRWGDTGQAELSA